jgi:PDZ domain-containing protein
MVICLLLVCLVPLNYVLWAPGNAVRLADNADPEAVISIDGVDAQINGQWLATELSQTGVDQGAVLPQVVAYLFLDEHDALPRQTVDVSSESTIPSDDNLSVDGNDASLAAVSAGVSQAGYPVTERPRIVSVRAGGPSDGLLAVGDFVLAINDQATPTAQSVRQDIADRQVGDPVVLTIQRDGLSSKVTIPALGGSTTNGTIATLGVTVAAGYSYEPDVHLLLTDSQVGPPQGLAIALTTYELLTPLDLAQGRSIAAVGVMADNGTIEAVSGIDEHVASARNAHADIIVIPRSNCQDLTQPDQSITVLPVRTLTDVITVLSSSDNSEWPSC